MGLRLDMGMDGWDPCNMIPSAEKHGNPKFFSVEIGIFPLPLSFMYEPTREMTEREFERKKYVVHHAAEITLGIRL